MVAVISSTVKLSTVWHLKTYLLQTSWMWRRNGRSPASVHQALRHGLRQPEGQSQTAHLYGGETG